MLDRSAERGRMGFAGQAVERLARAVRRQAHKVEIDVARVGEGVGDGRAGRALVAGLRHIRQGDVVAGQGELNLIGRVDQARIKIGEIAGHARELPLNAARGRQDDVAGLRTVVPALGQNLHGPALKKGLSHGVEPIRLACSVDLHRVDRSRFKNDPGVHAQGPDGVTRGQRPAAAHHDPTRRTCSAQNAAAVHADLAGEHAVQGQATGIDVH
ncbi:hypothetical protein D3C80_1205100 [compost metagenome]